MINKIDPINTNNDIPKYRKKKDQTSKSIKKSKHKHEYQDCLLLERDRAYKATYCKICGKIGDVNVFETDVIDDERGYGRILSRDEVCKKYKGLKRFFVNSIWDGYVVLDK